MAAQIADQFFDRCVQHRIGFNHGARAEDINEPYDFSVPFPSIVRSRLASVRRAARTSLSAFLIGGWTGLEEWFELD